MLTSNMQLGNILTMGGGGGGGRGASCPGRLILSPARLSERMVNQQILLHRILQKYFVERDINIISVNLRCLFLTSSRVMYLQEVGGGGGGAGQAVQDGLSCPSPRISEKENG